MIFETLHDSLKRRELILLRGGYCRYHLRRDGQLTIHEILSQKQGTGSKMLRQLMRVPGAHHITAKCPSDLASNEWYAKRGFRCIKEETTPSGRKLNVWQLPLTKQYAANPIITDENLIKYDRTTEELQLFWLYCGFSVGKTRAHAQGCLSALLDMGRGKLPFDRLQWLVDQGTLRKSVEACRIGGFDRIEGFIRGTLAAKLNLRKGKTTDFEAVHGIGLTKSRFFVLCTRGGARVAVLDRHILTFLRAQNYPDIPDDAPRNTAEYERVQGYFLQEADKAGKTPAVFNLQEWRQRAA